MPFFRFQLWWTLHTRRDSSVRPPSKGIPCWIHRCFADTSHQNLVSTCRINVELSGTYSPNKNANGILSLLFESVMIAEDTNGPMKADVFPTWMIWWDGMNRPWLILHTTENNAKKRNLDDWKIHIHQSVRAQGWLTFVEAEKLHLSWFDYTHTCRRKRLISCTMRQVGIAYHGQTITP